ncbi:MAG: ketopantoate reductase family protein [Kiritimatiellae bacterium]|nr:ketopantoate reductase family protein [Kiritimatiellia bacterium]MDD4341504.1 ketopantoate reductase family protein [Kiritimatiellia bacterium]
MPPPPSTDIPPIQHVALIGLGAIGTLYAAQIVARDPGGLRIIVDAQRRARYQADPPSLNGQPLELTYVLPEHPGPPADVVIVSVKSVALLDTLPAITPFIAPQTQILPLLNGITAQDVLADAFGWPHVLHGLVHCESSMRSGHAVIQRGGDKIIFGEARNAPPSPRVRAVAAWLERLGIRHKVPEDMRAAQWRKFILNVGINQAQAVLRAPCRELQQNPDSMRLARTLMDEAAAIAVALGIPGAADLPAWAESIIRAAEPDNKTSMLQDVEAGRPPEVDLLAGTVCRLGRAHGIPTPANQMVLQRVAMDDGKR